jgi:hypothetical protein
MEGGRIPARAGEGNVISTGDGWDDTIRMYGY